MRTLIAIMMVLILATPAMAQEPKKPSNFNKDFAVASAVYWGGSGLDLGASAARIDGVRIREGNFLLADSKGRLSIGKGLAITGAIYVGACLLNRKHPKAARRLLWGVGIGRGIVGTITLTL